MHADVDALLLSLARKHLSSSTLDSPGVPAYDRILYAWRIRHDDYRGAAGVLFERLERLKTVVGESGNGSGGRGFEIEDRSLLDAYLVLINTLACCGRDEGWILAEPIIESSGVTQQQQRGNNSDGGRGKRRIITLEDVRREYQAELDRRSEMVQGRFALVGDGDAMDVL